VRLAVYAGTFDPITLGHLSVVERGARLFDRLFVLVAVNPSKHPLFSAEERLSMLREVCARFDSVECAKTEGYVVEFAREKRARYLIRGVRSSTDVEGEIALANLNRSLAPEVETVFVPAHPELSEVSSSRLKELSRAREDVSRYCPPEIADRLRERALVTCEGETEVSHV
jgi:pantetheine-phosphate adenylyltransferase